MNLPAPLSALLAIGLMPLLCAAQPAKPQQAPIEQDALHDDAAPTTATKAAASEKPIHATIAIDWTKPEQPATRRQFSINATAGARPLLSVDPLYGKNMAYMNAEVLRYHKGIVPRAITGNDLKKNPNAGGWVDLANKTWNRATIRDSFKNFPIAPGTDIVVNIPNWPPWMDKDKRLDPAQYDAFADFCAELVRILNVELRLGVRYFEITNERDFVYWRAQQKIGEPPLTRELAKIFLLCAEAMKKVDPAIKTGGPAAASGEKNVFPMHREFIQLTRAQLDFFSFHGYATGTPDQPDALIYDKAAWLGSLIKKHRALLDELSPDRHIEVHLNEYNISWTWKISEPRMRNHKGAVFDSLFLIAAVKARADVTNAWNDQEGTYGKMDVKNGYILRPPAHVFHYFNNWLVGRSASATTTHPKAVVPFAVESADGTRAFVLVNRSNAANTATLTFAGQSPSTATVTTARISEKGPTGLETSDIPAATLRAPLTLPPHSVTFYRINK
ncbi:alpha-L-arabinofuranosidase [Opitutaceae bacterium TAV4]|nr:alpha-L-arabinofuranosidase [Opitutaceae bacterium TAV4]RRJ99534.1 alpha-L-arabinofuranosidase [Opitutaceae bacterium TAV3]